MNQNADVNVAANALGKISLLDNQPEQTVTESDFMKTAAAGHRGIRSVFVGVQVQARVRGQWMGSWVSG